MNHSPLSLASSRSTLRRFLREFLAKRSGLLVIAGESAVEREDVSSLIRSCVEEWQTVRDVRLEHTALAFRAALRDDPDLLFVGEIKDADLARDVSHAALLGHLVVATAQGSDASRVLARLARAVGDDFLFASSLLGVITSEGGRLEGRLIDLPLREALMRGEEGEHLSQIFSQHSLVV